MSGSRGETAISPQARAQLDLSETREKTVLLKTGVTDTLYVPIKLSL
jgi:hypothetical protein